MGFYSFYRVIKDIFCTLFGKKFFKIVLISLIFIFIIMCFSSSSFCSFSLHSSKYDIDVTFPYEGNENYHYYVFIKPITGTSNSEAIEISAVVSTTPIVCSKNEKFENLISVSPLDNGVIVRSVTRTTFGNPSNLEYIVQDFIDDYYSDFDFDYNAANSSITSCTIKGYFEDFPEVMTNSYILSNSGDVIVGEIPINTPKFGNSKEELESGNFDYIKIYYNDIDIINDYFVFSIYEGIQIDTDLYDYVAKTSFKLDMHSSYNTVEGDYYLIPKEKLGVSFDNNKHYLFRLTDRISSDTIYDDIEFTVVGRTDSEIIQDKEDEQTGVIREQTEAINEQTNVIKDTSDKIFSDEYDESQISIDTELSDDIDSSSYTNFITAIINAIKNAVTGNWDTVEQISLPLPFVDESIVLKSDLMSSYIPSVLKVLINAFWMFLFGKYIFKFALAMVSSLKSGEILDGKMNLNDEVITSSML